MPKLSPEDEQKSLLGKAEAALAKANDKRVTLVAKATAAAEKATKAKTDADTAEAGVTAHDAEIERLKRHVAWVQSMPTGAPVQPDAEFGDATVDDEDDVLV